MSSWESPCCWPGCLIGWPEQRGKKEEKGKKKKAKDESILPAPPRAEGDGPFKRLILRGVTLIDGTGAPPIGPVDIVIEKNRIAAVAPVGSPGVAPDPEERPKAEAGDREMDLHGMYVLPGFVDMHGHIGGKEQGTPAEYVFKLWMGHGITTVRDPGSGNGLDWTLDQRAKSAAQRDHGAAHQGLHLLRHGARRAASPSPRRRAGGSTASPPAAPTASSSSATGRTSCRRRSRR